jgi:hypothetical protein
MPVSYCYTYDNLLKMNIWISAFYILLFPLQKDNILDLKDYEWSYRLICIETNNHVEADNQLSLFKKSIKENKERKLKFLVKISNQFYEGLELRKVDQIKNFPIKLKNQSYAMTLIGLDGGIKNRWFELVDASEIYQKIDAMPMRISEIKQN